MDSSRQHKQHFNPSDRIAQLKSLSRKGQTLTIEHLDLGPLTIENFSTHLAFEQQTLKMQNLAMNLLGGGIGGNVIIAAERPLRISARFEVAHLDANQLITTHSKIQGDSNIDATVELATFLQDATGAVDLSRLACNLQITHIGKEALERLLTFLDPEGSNPTLSNAKAQLRARQSFASDGGSSQRPIESDDSLSRKPDPHLSTGSRPSRQNEKPRSTHGHDSQLGDARSSARHDCR